MNVTIDVLFKIFFMAIIVDFITGVLVAAKEGRLKSRTCSNGIFRTLAECIILIMFMYVNYCIPSLGAFLNTFVVGFIFKEGLSICENLVKLDAWIPQIIKNSLEVGVNKVDKGEK